MIVPSLDSCLYLSPSLGNIYDKYTCIYLPRITDKGSIVFDKQFIISLVTNSIKTVVYIHLLLICFVYTMYIYQGYICTRGDAKTYIHAFCSGR